ncbi:hypothetical protein JVU11DRAFT_3451 [Chiua virens]|nr:hypothetical protein JVU11DRAFT_3451 [Chiua virens]
MAYLSRRPDTLYLRLLLLPIVVCLTFGTYFRFMYTDPKLNIYNWSQGLFAQAICGKAIDCAWRRDGMLKMGETKPGILAKSISNRHSNGNLDGHASTIGGKDKRANAALALRRVRGSVRYSWTGMAV